MSTPLFGEPDPQPPKITERHMLDCLAKRYSFESFGARRYAIAEHVPIKPVWAQRIADFIAVDCWRGTWADWRTDEQQDYSTGWGYAVHGHEVKVSRADWLTELRCPEKAQAFTRYCDYWWLVVSDASIVRDGELPDGWGLMVRRGASLRAAVRPTRNLAVEPMPRELSVSLLRSAVKTAVRSSGAGQERGQG